MSDMNKDVPPAPAAASGQVGNTPLQLATQKQKIILILCHLAVALVMLCATYMTIQKFNKITFVETLASWEMPSGAHLKKGPTSFQYDSESHALRHRGPLDVQQQLQLRDLLEFDAGSSEDSSVQPISTQSINAAIRSYQAAIDKLAYQAGAAQIDQIQLLLLLGLFGGTLGALLRSLVDFIGHACYTRQLDLMHWWPLYVTRPLVGAILGFVLVILLKARLLTSVDIQQVNESFWWLGVAVIGGFSTMDVTARLRLAAKALFGTDDRNKNR